MYNEGNKQSQSKMIGNITVSRFYRQKFSSVIFVLFYTNFRPVLDIYANYMYIHIYLCILLFFYAISYLRFYIYTYLLQRTYKPPQ